MTRRKRYFTKRWKRNRQKELRDYLKAAGFRSFGQLSRFVDEDPSYVLRVLYLQQPGRPIRAKLAKALRTTVEELFERYEEDDTERIA